MAENTFNIERFTGTIAVTTPAAAGTVPMFLEGMTKQIGVKIPDLTATGFGTLSIKQDGYTQFNSGSQTEAGTYVVGSEVSFTGSQSVVFNADGTQSATVNVIFDIWYTR